MQAGLADFSGTSSEQDPGTERCWEFGHPFVKYDDGLDTLSDETRERLDRRESEFTSEEREKAVAALRVLVTAHSQGGDVWASLDDPSCRLFVEPYDSDGFYLTIEAPEPGDDEASRLRGRSRSALGCLTIPTRSLGTTPARQATP
ncbi:hypothetical protein [Streptomyces sp. NPDC060198]|uniref:hypothetical protein n=1 Tax=Streptomyces sp. NPDC060198 TaxID=3347070 RepID=UPI00366048B1